MITVELTNKQYANMMSNKGVYEATLALYDGNKSKITKYDEALITILKQIVQLLETIQDGVKDDDTEL